MLGCTSVNVPTDKAIVDNDGMIELKSKWNSERDMRELFNANETDLKPVFYFSNYPNNSDGYSFSGNTNYFYVGSPNYTSFKSVSKTSGSYGKLSDKVRADSCIIRVFIDTDMSVKNVTYLTGNKRVFNSKKKDYILQKYEITSNTIPGPWELDFKITIGNYYPSQTIPISYRTAVGDI
jgi:hypothetical protein